MSVGEIGDHQKQQHEQIYYPACRVVAKHAGGSGICIYSDRDENGNAVSLVITNHHVVEGLIEVEERWDPRLQREYPQEKKEAATVQFFEFNDHSKAVGTQSYKAEIVAWDDKTRRDIALLKLRETEETMDHVARLYPYEKQDQIYMFDEVYAVGAALGHPVFQTPGEVTNASVEIGEQEYIGTNSPITFGNSGGGLFKKGEDENYYLIGLPARVDLEGWGSVANHIGFVVPISSVYNFLEDNYFNYVWDDSVTVEECDEHREEMREEAKNRLLG